VQAAIEGRTFKLRLHHKPGQFVRAFVNGRLGAELAPNFLIPPGATTYSSVLSAFAESGDVAVNVRSWVGQFQLAVFGLD
jgi:hypothetical protein